MVVWVINQLCCPKNQVSGDQEALVSLYHMERPISCTKKRVPRADTQTGQVAPQRLFLGSGGQPCILPIISPFYLSWFEWTCVPHILEASNGSILPTLHK